MWEVGMLASRFLCGVTLGLTSLAMASPAGAGRIFGTARQSSGQDQQSVAEAAKRAQEIKKKSPKAAKVLTEEDLKKGTPEAEPRANATPATAAAEPQAAAPAEAPRPAATPADSAEDLAPKDSDSPEVKQAKVELAQAEADLDLAKRELSLEQDNVYRSPDYARDSAGKARIEALKQQATDRQAEVARKKAHLSEILAKAQ
jgi:hypothetical protein